MTAYRHEVPGGAAWSLPLHRHHRLRLDALGDGANVSMLLFAAANPLERLNIPDTLKAQMSACLRPPVVLMSDVGRALATVAGSSLDWHDAISGHSTDRHLERFGPSSYAEHRNDWRRSARTGLLDELRTNGLDERDLHATANWFSKVAPAGDERGTLAYAPDHCTAGDWVELRAEQDLLVVLSTAPHPLDPAPEWRPVAVRAEVTAGVAPAADDPARLFRAESARALTAAERTYA